MTDAPELKPCPFCGGGARIYQDPSHSTAWFCGCEDWDCFGNMMWDETKTGATDKWNRRADLSSPLGVVAMRDAAIAEIDCGGCYGTCVDPANCRLEDVAAIRTLPLPTHAALLAAALKLPEVAAMVEAERERCAVIAEGIDAKAFRARYDVTYTKKRFDQYSHENGVNNALNIQAEDAAAAIRTGAKP